MEFVKSLLKGMFGSVGMAGGIMTGLKILSEVGSAAKSVVTTAQEVRKQLTPEGPEDNVKFEHLLLELDGVHAVIRPKQKVIVSFLDFLSEKEKDFNDPDVKEYGRRQKDYFRWILALNMSKEDAIIYLNNLVKIRVDDDPLSKDSNVLRYKTAKRLLERHKNDFQKFFDDHERIKQVVTSIPVKAKDLLNSASNNIESDLQDSGLQTGLDNVQKNIWAQVEEKRAERRNRGGK